MEVIKRHFKENKMVPVSKERPRQILEAYLFQLGEQLEEKITRVRNALIIIHMIAHTRVIAQVMRHQNFKLL